MKKYNYLQKFIINPNIIPDKTTNAFSLINKEIINEAETKLGFKFPIALKEFWQEIGEGRLDNNILGENAWDYANYILSPQEIASIILEEEDAPMLPFAREYLAKGDIPFFEIMDSTDFLVMKKDSSKPDMVYDMLGGEIDHFEQFIWRLYHESPIYYEAIISQNLENIEKKSQIKAIS